MRLTPVIQGADLSNVLVSWLSRSLRIAGACNKIHFSHVWICTLVGVWPGFAWILLQAAGLVLVCSMHLQFEAGTNEAITWGMFSGRIMGVSEAKPSCVSTKAFACCKFTDTPVANVSHVAKLNISGAGEGSLPTLVRGAEKSQGKGQDGTIPLPEGCEERGIIQSTENRRGE